MPTGRGRSRDPALGRESVESLDRLLQRVCGNIDLACQVCDGVGALDGTLLIKSSDRVRFFSGLAPDTYRPT